jgi:hypothetical protein
MEKQLKNGIILNNNTMLTIGLRVWQSLIQLSKGKKFFDRYYVKCTGYVGFEDVKLFLKSGWAIGAIAATALQFNGFQTSLSKEDGYRVALLVHFKTQECKIVMKNLNPEQLELMKKHNYTLCKAPMVVHAAEDFKAQVWAD